jgi:hypothetical protein
MREEFEPYYTAIGRALTTWGQLEDALCRVYCHTISTNSYPARAGFWVVESFRAKLGMTDAVVSARFSRTADIATEWNALHNRLLKKNQTRNALAHGSVINQSYTKPKTKKKERETFFAPFYWKGDRIFKIADSFAKHGVYDGRPDNRMYLKDIEQAEDGFRKATDRLSELSDRIYELQRQEEDRILEDAPRQ